MGSLSTCLSKITFFGKRQSWKTPPTFRPHVFFSIRTSAPDQFVSQLSFLPPSWPAPRIPSESFKRTSGRGGVQHVAIKCTPPPRNVTPPTDWRCSKNRKCDSRLSVHQTLMACQLNNNNNLGQPGLLSSQMPSEGRGLWKLDSSRWRATGWGKSTPASDALLFTLGKGLIGTRQAG